MNVSPHQLSQAGRIRGFCESKNHRLFRLRAYECAIGKIYARYNWRPIAWPSFHF